MCLQLLAREAGKFQEAETWLQSNTLLTPNQRASILDKLLQMQQKSQVSQSVEPGTPKQPTERPLWNSSSDARPADTARPQDPPFAPSASGSTPQRHQQPEGRSPKRVEGSANCSSAVQSELADNAGISRDAAASSGAHERPDQVSWYGDLSGSLSRWWSQVMGTRPSAV